MPWAGPSSRGDSMAPRWLPDAGRAFWATSTNVTRAGWFRPCEIFAQESASVTLCASLAVSLYYNLISFRDSRWFTINQGPTSYGA